MVSDLNNESEEGFAGLENLGQVAMAEAIAPVAELKYPIIHEEVDDLDEETSDQVNEFS